jgi:hypothetical protein
MVGYLTNIYCPTVGHWIENLLKKSNAPPVPDPPLGLNIDRCIMAIHYATKKATTLQQLGSSNCCKL